ncbi:MAG: protease Do [Myxococcales bacterium]|nr:protease Do [Myxococcales bacterium]
MSSSLRTSLLAAVAAVGLIGTGAALHSGTTSAYATPAMPTDGSIADVAERVVDSVVNISVSGESRGGPASFDPFFSDPSSPFFGQQQRGRRAEAKGSGVIVTADGRILTNSHVVNGFTDIKVTLQDGTELDAKVVGKDPKADLAVLQLKGKFPPLKPIAFGDSSAARLGEVVLAVGDGMGVGKSVSMGIVSAKGRGSVGIEEYEDFIQTDAAINPGNSGGALVNLKGELIGINTAIASRSGGYQGIGFAIPTNMARPIMDMLVRDGKVARGYLGANIATVSSSLLKLHKLKVGATSGVAVARLDSNGPGAKAGLRQGDVIVAMNGVPMRSSDVLRNTIAMTKPGTTVDLEVVHSDGAKDAVKAKLGELPEQVAQDAQDDSQDPQDSQDEAEPFQNMPRGMQGPNIQQWQMDPSTGQWQRVQPTPHKRHR